MTHKNVSKRELFARWYHKWMAKSVEIINFRERVWKLQDGRSLCTHFNGVLYFIAQRAFKHGYRKGVEAERARAAKRIAQLEAANEAAGW